MSLEQLETVLIITTTLCALTVIVGTIWLLVTLRELRQEIRRRFRRPSFERDSAGRPIHERL